MWCRSTRRDSQPGNRQRQWSRSRAARRSAAFGRRRRRPRSRMAPSPVVPHPGQRGGAAEHLRGADADGRAVLHVAAGRVRRVTRRGPGGRRLRGDAGARAGPGGEGVGADVDDDLVHLRVIARRRPCRPGTPRRCQQRIGQAGGRRRAGGPAARVSAETPSVPVVGVVQVPGRGAQRLQQHRAGQRRQPERPRQRPVLLEPPGQPPPDPRRGVIGAGDLPVRAGEPLQLVPGHRPGQLRQPRLVLRRGDPGQRPHLGIRQAGRPELGADHRQVPQRPGHPDVLPRGAGGHLALPRQPLRAAVHLPGRPAAAGVEVSQQDQEPARRRGQVPGQLADLRLQPLQRHRGGAGRYRGQGGQGAELGVSTSNMYLTLAGGSDNPGRTAPGPCRGKLRG